VAWWQTARRRSLWPGVASLLPLVVAALAAVGSAPSGRVYFQRPSAPKGLLWPRRYGGAGSSRRARLACPTIQRLASILVSAASLPCMGGSIKCDRLPAGSLAPPPLPRRASVTACPSLPALGCTRRLPSGASGTAAVASAPSWRSAAAAADRRGRAPVRSRDRPPLARRRGREVVRWTWVTRRVGTRLGGASQSEEAPSVMAAPVFFP